MSARLFQAEDLCAFFASIPFEDMGIYDQVWANYYGFVEDDWFWELV